MRNPPFTRRQWLALQNVVRGDLRMHCTTRDSLLRRKLIVKTADGGFRPTAWGIKIAAAFSARMAAFMEANKK